MLFIISENSQHANNFAGLHHLIGKEYNYVSGLHILRGIDINTSSFIFLDGWNIRNDAYEIFHCVEKLRQLRSK